MEVGKLLPHLPSYESKVRLGEGLEPEGLDPAIKKTARNVNYFKVLYWINLSFISLVSNLFPLANTVALLRYDPFTHFDRGE